MIDILLKTVAFIRWICSAEQLPSPSEKHSPAGPRADGFARRLLRIDEPLQSLESDAPPTSRRGTLAWLLAGENLPQDVAPACPSWSGFWSWRLDAEICPELDPAPAKRRPGFWSWRLEAEIFPEVESAPAERRPGFLRRMLSVDVCPQYEAPASHREAGFFRWLFSQEKL